MSEREEGEEVEEQEEEEPKIILKKEDIAKGLSQVAKIHGKLFPLQNVYSLIRRFNLRIRESYFGGKGPTT